MDRHSPNVTEQAISILRQFAESGGHSLIYQDYGSGQIVFQVDNIGAITFTEGEFIQDDLDQLASLDLLRLEHGSDGMQIYHITRRTKPFLASLSPTPTKAGGDRDKSGGQSRLLSGERVGEWVLHESIGQGGNGFVWSATGLGGERAAIKFLKPEYFGQQREKRFRDEIEFLRRENGRTGILPLIDYNLPSPGNPDQRLWFATPLAICFTGLKLANAENLEKLVEYTRDVAQTLAKLHAERKWHRDLKPENLFMLNGVPVIGDFGLVDFPDKEPNTRASEHVGSRNYTAPELEGDAGDVLAGPADVYSLAKTLWTLASGKAHPPPGHLRMDTEELRFSHICTHQRALSLDHLIERSTTHSLTNRPTMESFASELSAWLTQPTKTDSPTSAALSPDHKALFEMERRTRLAKEQLIQSASAIISFFQPVLQEIAQATQSAVLVD